MCSKNRECRIFIMGFIHFGSAAQQVLKIVKNGNIVVLFVLYFV
jgi:hypothetical protein